MTLRWTDQQIDALRHRFSPDGTKNLITNQFFEELLNVNRWQRKVNFSLTVNDDLQVYRGRSLKDNLMVRGMVTQLYPGKRPGAIDVETTKKLYTDHFLYRSIKDNTVYKDERSLSLTGNYATIIAKTADSLRRAGDYENAIKETKKALEFIPYEYSTYDFLTQLYIESGQDSLVLSTISKVPRTRRARLYHLWASFHKYKGNREKADEIFGITLDSFPHSNEVFEEYSRMLFEGREFEKLYGLTREWLSNNPGDSLGNMLFRELSRRRKQVPVEIQPTDQDS